jgi:ribosomal protein L11 methyltransferase
LNIEHLFMTNYIEIIFPVSKQSEKDVLIAQLSIRGFEGFEEERNSLKAFIREEDFDEQELTAFAGEQQLSFTRSAIENKNWNAEWEANFQPVVIDGFCAVRAAFHPPVPGVAHDIIVTPKMSFGTGHHATTYMMVQAMARPVFAGKTVFDFGTGTGVLAILAEKLGALSITAIDNDDNSIENAAENLAANGCRHCELFKAASTEGLGQFDIILANINRNVILQNLLHIKQHLRDGGVVLLSGLLKDDQPQVLAEAEKQGLMLTGRLEKEGWICLEMGKTVA